jgi:RHS repeat-associated protein
MHSLTKAVQLGLTVACLHGLSPEFVSASSKFRDEFGPNHRNLKLDRVRDAVEPQGAEHSLQEKEIVEIATGLNYWNGQEWLPSSAQFELTPDAFVANRMQHMVSLNDNLNRVGAVTIVTHDSQVLHSTPVAIGLYDAASGRSTIIAAITNSLGVLVGENKVIFENAFAGLDGEGICADVIYTVDRASFEQDVVITGRLDPEEYGFPRETTRIQIYTEFYETPNPQRVRRAIRMEQKEDVRKRMESPDLVDEVLGFGEFVMATGSAFQAERGRNSAVPVAKEFLTRSGRTFLIESVEYPAIRQHLESLPPCRPRNAALNRGLKRDGSKVDYAKVPRAAARNLAQTPIRDSSTRLTKANVLPREGVVIDYIATVGGTLNNPVPPFKGDTTYFVSGTVVCNGPATIEGGAVFKFKHQTVAPVGFATIRFNNSVVCKTSNYRPATFTAADDDSIGDSLNGYPGAGYQQPIRTNGYANPAIHLNWVSSQQLTNLRFSYCQEAVRVEGGSDNSIWHSQLVKCIRGIVITGSGSGSSGSASMVVNNTLWAEVTSPIIIHEPNFSLTLYHSTVDGGPGVTLVQATASDVSFSAFNSVFSRITTSSSGGPSVSGTRNGFYTAPTFGTQASNSTVSPFQISGAGNYYLNATSSFRNVGLTNIVPTAVRTAVAQRTTGAPTVHTNAIAANTTWGPVVSRDTDLPDLGFHYPAIDYLVSGVGISGAGLALSNGVQVATFGQYGFNLQANSSVFSEAPPTNMNRIMRYHAVQEQPILLGTNAESFFLVPDGLNGAARPLIDIKFTELIGLAGPSGARRLWNDTARLRNAAFQDSALRGITLRRITSNDFGGQTITMTNNVIERSEAIFHRGAHADNTPLTVYLQNNLFRGGTLELRYDSFGGSDATPTFWDVYDNAFDILNLVEDGVYAIPEAYFGIHIRNGFNAYISTTNQLVNSVGGNVNLTNFVYQSGRLGDWYQSSTNLVDRGSRTADLVGLYHHTTRTNQVKEAATAVDIGFHYIAVNSAGNPIDTDGDGTPDYREDRNGNGIVDPGETAYSFSPTSSLTAPAAGATFDTPTNITVSASASDADGVVVLVEFRSGGTVLGWDGTSPYSLVWSNAPAGVHNLTAVATDNAGLSTTSSVVTVTVRNHALLVVGNTTLTASDVAVSNRLVSLGFFITAKTGAAATTGDAVGKRLVVISATAPSADVNTKFTDVGVPVLTWEDALYDDLNYTGTTSGTHFGIASGQTQLVITNASHPIAAGLSGTVTVAASSSFAWGKPNSNAFVVARLTGADTTRIAVFGYEAGAVTQATNAPARRVGLFLSDTTATSVNSNGWRIFDAAVQWAVGTNLPPTVNLLFPATNTIITAGTPITFVAQATDNDSGIKKVTFFGNATRIGQANVISNNNHYRFTVTNFPAGTYEVYAKAFDKGGLYAISTQVVILTIRSNALFIVGNTTLNASDNAVSNRLFNMGFVVTTKLASAATSGDADAKTLVVISATAPGGDVTNKFRSVTAPVLTWEDARFDDMGLVGPIDGTDSGNTSGQTQLVIAASSHPMAAGLTGTNSIFTNATQVAWGKPNSNAVRIATQVGDSSRAVIFGYEHGSPMFGLNAPARRVGFFLAETNANLMSLQGWALFEAAVIWAISKPCPPTVDVMLVVDKSSSMNGQPLIDAKAAAKSFVTDLELDPDKVGLVTFWSTSRLDHVLTTNASLVIGAIDAITNNTGSRIDFGITNAQGQLTSTNHNPVAAPVIILLSDGKPTQGSTEADVTTAANNAKNAGTRIFVVGFGDVNHNLLQSLASSAGDYYYTPESSELSDVYASIAASLCRHANNPPTVAITNPALGTIFRSPTNLTIQATAADSDGTVVSVEFFGNGTSFGTDLTAPYAIVRSNMTSGIYTLTAVARDDDGLSATSAPVQITINSAPLVNAGPDQIVCPSPAATLSGSVVDDGFPTPPSLTFQWSQVSGPGTVSFGTPSSTNTTATFPVSGVYRLQLFASDNNLSSVDTLDVTVRSLVTGVGPTNLVRNPGQTAIFTITPSGSGPLTNRWRKGASVLPGQTGNSLVITNVTVADAGIYSVEVTGPCNSVTNSATLTVRQPPSVSITSPTNNATFCPSKPITITAQATDPDGIVTHVHFFSGSNFLGSTITPTGNLFSFTWAAAPPGTNILSAVAWDNDGFSSTSPSIAIRVVVPVDVNAGTDKTVLLTNGTVSVALNGIVTGPGNVTSLWTRAAGPTNVQWINVTSPGATATFTAPGNFLLRLEAGDGCSWDSDIVMITVLSNQPPLVDAGPDRTILANTAASLQGWVQDDGMPRPPFLTNFWKTVTGPTNAIFATTNSPVTTATNFTTPGVYTLRLTASDGLATNSDDMVVYVVPAGGRTWTFDADFEEGALLNVNYDAVPDQLQLNRSIRPFPYVWIACSDRGTIVRIDVNTGQVLGEYRTAPQNFFGNPSRTTVDRHGNAWVGNRNDTSIARVGIVIGGVRGWIKTNLAGVVTNFVADPKGQYLQPPFEYSTAVDRNKDGYIKTSWGLTNLLAWDPDGVGYDDAGGVSSAEDECIINYTRVTGSGTRTIAVDANNDIWVGGHNTEHEKVSGITGQIIPNTTFSPPGGGYGGLVDGHGVLWSANSLFRFTPQQRFNLSVFPPTITNSGYVGTTVRPNYGIGIDPLTGRIWAGENDCMTWVIEPNGTVITNYFHGACNAQGLAVDDQNSVWVAHSLHLNTVGRLRTDGTFIGNVSLGCDMNHGPTGVAVDANGKIWVACLNSSKAMRIDPNEGPRGTDGVRIGAVDLVVDLNDTNIINGTVPNPYNHSSSAGPYNYSDMTGFVSIGATAPSGTWTVVHDSGITNLQWGRISWNAFTNTNATVKVEVRAGTNYTSLTATNNPFRLVTNGIAFSGVAGRFAEIRATLGRVAQSTDTPILYDLTIVPAANAAVIDQGMSLARSDFFQIRQDTTTNLLDVLRNDAVLIGGGARIVSWSSPRAGYLWTNTVSLNITNDDNEIEARPPGTVLYYSPNPGFFGEDRFTYAVADPVDGINRGVARVYVEKAIAVPPNAEALPIAVADTYQFLMDTGGNYMDVMGNDTNANSIVGFTQPAHGMVERHICGLLYTPNPGFTGVDIFSYTVIGNQGGFARTNVTITVSTNYVPRLEVLLGTNKLNHGSTILMTVTGTGSSITNTLTLTNAGTAGLQIQGWPFVSGNAAGNFSTVPGSSSIFLLPGETSMVEVVFSAATLGFHSASLLIATNSNVLGVPLGPIIHFSASVSPSTGGQPTISLLAPTTGSVFAGYSDITLVATNSGGTTPTNVVFTFETAAGLFLIGEDSTAPYSTVWESAPPGTYSLKAYAFDQNNRVGISAPVQITIKEWPGDGTNLPPIAIDDQKVVPMRTNPAVVITHPIYVLANDYDPNLDDLSIVEFTQGSLGAVTRNGDVLYYSPHVGVSGGPDVVHYTISDGRTGRASARAIVNISATPPPAVEITAPANGSLVQRQSGVNSIVTVTVSASVGVTNVSYYVGDQRLTESTNSPAFTIMWTNPPAGNHSLVAVASSTNGLIGYSVPVNIFVAAPNGNRRPVSAIANFAPLPWGDEDLEALFEDVMERPPVVSAGITNLIGTASDPDSDPVTYRVFLYNADRVRVAELTPTPQTPGVNVNLGALHFDRFENGHYEIELVVSDSFSQSSTRRKIILNSQLKIGHFGFTVQDLILPVGGIPLTIMRTYNSFNTQEGDFGFSWNMSINGMDVSINENRTDVLDDDGQTFSLRIGGGYDVSLTLPDGQRATFPFTLNPAGLATYEPEWLSPPGVNAALRQLGSAKMVGLPFPYWHAGGGANSSLEYFDFPGWELQTQDGTKYLIQREELGVHSLLDNAMDSEWEEEPTWGNYFEQTYIEAWGQPRLTHILQQSGDTIEITENQINHYNATNALTRSIFMRRDGKGRVKEIRDPNSGSNGVAILKYEYDSRGNLWQVLRLTDRNANGGLGAYDTTTYQYTNANFPHFITDILDPRGARVAKTFYDENGRISAIEDAEGKKTQFFHNLGSRLEIVTDRMGVTNSFVYDVSGNVVWITNALNLVTRMSYDPANYKIAETNALGTAEQTWTLFAYDGNGYLTNVTAINQTNSWLYDDAGHLLTHIDPLRNVISNRYDQVGNLTNTVKRNAQGIIVEQSSSSYINGRLVETRNGSNQITASFSYDVMGNMTNSTDAAGVSHSISYDANGKQTNSSYIWIAPGGTPVTVSKSTEYDATGRPTRMVDAHGNEGRVHLNAIGSPEQTVDKYGNTNSYTYNARGHLIETRFWNGFFTRTVYDDNARPIITTDPNQITGARTEYDSAGRVTNVVKLMNVQVDLVADPINSGHVRSVLSAVGTAIATNSTEYFPNGWVKSRTGTDRRKTSYEYWPSGQVKAVTDPLNNVTYYEYNAAGNQNLVRDALNRTNRFEYDGVGRLIKTIYPNSSFTSNAFNLLGERVAEIDQAGLQTQFKHDVSGLITNVIKPQVLDPENGDVLLNPAWSYRYDPYGRLSVVTDPKGRTNTFTYNAFGQQLTQRLPMGQTETNEYNSKGQLWRRFDCKGQKTEFVYDKFGRVRAKFLFAAGATSPSNAVCYQYYPLGQLWKIVERSGPDATANACDGYAALVGWPNGGPNADNRWLARLWTFAPYVLCLLILGLCGFAMGSIPKETWALIATRLRTPTVDEQTLSSARRLRLPSLFWRFVTVIIVIALIGSDPSIDYLLSANAQCTVPYNPSSETTRITEFTYDFDSQLTQINSPEGVINYGYDLATGRHTRTCTKNSELAYAYDELGRLKTVTVLKRNGVTVSPPEVTTYAYTAVGSRESVTLANGIVTAYQYDALNRLTNLTHQVGSTNLATYRYQLHPTGRRTNAVEILRQEDGTYLTNTHAWKYDGMYRLTNEVVASSASAGQYATEYHYDRVGNRLKKILTQGANVTTITNEYNNNDQLLKEVTKLNSAITGTTSFDYDANGSLTSKSNATAITTYNYNLANRLSSATIDGLTINYVYDASGMRVRSYTASNTQLFLIDPNNHTGYAQVLEELDDVGGSPSQSYVIGDDIIAQSAGGVSAPSYLLYDGHGSTRQLVQNTGAVINHFNYDAYGEMLSTSSPNPGTTLRYCGEQFDVNLKMYNLRARYYDPATGRFNQRDSFAGNEFDPETLHKYAYAHQDPVNGIDPSGNFTVLEVLSVVGIIATVASIFLQVVRAVNNLKALDELIEVNWLLNQLDLEPIFLVLFSHYAFGMALHIIHNLAKIGLSIVKEIVGCLSGAAGAAFFLSDTLLGGDDDDDFGNSAEVETPTRLAEDEDEFNSDNSIVHLARWGRKFQRDVSKIHGLKTGKIKVGKNKWRYPDGLNHTLKTLDEVKSVRNLRYTKQLQDYFKFAKGKYKMTIHLNKNKRPKIAKVLQKMEKKGDITILRH